MDITCFCETFAISVIFWILIKVYFCKQTAAKIADCEMTMTMLSNFEILLEISTTKYYPPKF